MTTPATPPPSPKTAQQPEPWLRGTHTEIPAVLRAILHAFDLCREDVRIWCDALTDRDLYAAPYGLTPVSFHLRHIPRSLDRLLTYAEGNQLSSEQIAALKTELDPADGPHPSREQLFSEFDQGIAAAADRVRAFASADLDEPRGVGKKQLPTSVGGLLIHLADHTQRHTGQIVTTAKVLLNSR